MARLAYDTAGDASLPSVVLLHGFMGSREDWREVTSRLAGQFHCICVDLPGHGESPIEVGDDFVYTAAGIIEIVDEVDVATFGLVGYSMGGRLALYTAIHYSMRADAVVIESASPGLRSDSERAARQKWEVEMANRMRNESLDSFLRDWYAQPLFASLQSYPRHLESILARRMKNDPEKLARAMVQLGSGNQPSVWDDLNEHYLPTLFVAGELDEKYRALAMEMAELCPEGRTAIVPGTGHNVHVEAPDAFVDEVTAFLSAALHT